MKRQTLLSIGLAVGCAVFCLATPLAQAATPAPSAAGSTFQQRLDQRKAEQGVNLAPNDAQRITSVCTTAQGTVRPIQANMVSLLENRTKTYQRIDAKLWVTIGELKLANKDTFQLEKDRSDFADKTNTFQSLSTNFSQTLDDIGVINCAADPTGFRALLNTAQYYYGQVIAQSADNRNFVVNTIKPELASHVSDLQTKSSTDKGNN